MLEGADDQNFVFIVAAASEEATDFEALSEERRHKGARLSVSRVGGVGGGGGGEMLHGVYEVQTKIRAASGALLFPGRAILQTDLMIQGDN